MSVLAQERQGTARYFQALAQHWPFIVGTVVFALATAGLYLASAEDRYEASADVLVSPVSPNDETFVGIGVIRDTGEGRGVLTVARLMRTPEVADTARVMLRTGDPRDELLDSVQVAPQAQSNIVTVTGEATTAERSAAIANAFAAAVVAERTRAFQRELRQVVRRLATRLARVPSGSAEGGALANRLSDLRGLVGSRDPTLQIVSAAVPPTRPSWPRPVLSLAAAFLVGLVLGIGIAILLEHVNPLVLRDEDILEEGMMLLGRVPWIWAPDLQKYLRGETGLAGVVTDAYRLVRVNLAAAHAVETGPATMLVTSSGRRDGKTTAAVSLAHVYAQTGARVVLVDADFRRSRLTELFGVPATTGLREVLLDEADVDEALVEAPGHGQLLRLLPARPDVGVPIDVLQSERAQAVVDELRSHADVVIFDAPPLTDVADALRLATAVDAVVMVVRFGRTRRDRLAQARLLLAQLGVVPAGCIAVIRRRAELQFAPAPSRDQRLPELKASTSAPKASASGRTSHARTSARR